MSQNRYCEVIFGIGGLATVGYRLFNPDGTANGARITAGITERGIDTGIYGALVTFPDAFDGEIRWDTGTGSPIYASEDIHLVAAPVEMNAEIIENPGSAVQMNVALSETPVAPIQMNVQIIENP